MMPRVAITMSIVLAHGDAQRMEQPIVLRGLLLAQSQQGAKAPFDGLAGCAGATRFQVLFHLRRADLSAISVTFGGRVRPAGRGNLISDSVSVWGVEQVMRCVSAGEFN